MLKSREAVELYLRRTKQLIGEADSVDNAGGTFSPPSLDDSEYLEGLITVNSQINRNVLYFALFLIFAVFVAVTISAQRTGSIHVLLQVLGVGTASEAGLLTWVLRIWAEYNRFSVILILCRKLSPEDLMKAMLSLNLGFGEKANQGKKTKGSELI